MLISRLKLQNWKNFQNLDINLKDRAFIVGANASGKSNLLDVLRFLRDIVKQSGGLQYAVEARHGVPKLRCLSARQNSSISIEVHISDDNEVNPKWIYKLSFKNSGGGIFKNQAQIIEEQVYDNKGKSLLNRNENDAKNEDQETLKFTQLEQVASNKKFREIYLFFLELQYLHIIPQLVRDSDSYMLANNKEDFYGRNLLERMSKTNTKTRDSYLNKINQVLQVAVPQLQELSFLKDPKTGISHLEAKYIHWRPKGGKQQEAQFSDGTLRLIGFMWALLDGSETILLEEPELYLHAAIVKQLPEFISKLQRRKNRKRQVIITTHSYDLLSSEGIGADEVIVLQTTIEGTTAKTAESINEIKQFISSGFSVAEAVLPAIAPKKIENILQLKIYE